MGIRGGLVMKDFCLEQNTNSEIPALIGEMLGTAGVNIEGLCLITCEELTLIHFAVEDAVTARRVLENAGIKIRRVSEVFVLSKDKKRVTGKPGSFGEICRTLADHGIKINFGYPVEHNRFVFGVDDVAKAHELLE
jgi:hypothetical protein